MALNTIEEVIADFRQGKMVIMMDDENRENEGDLIMAAEAVTTEAINFMAKEARGLICLTLTEERCKKLELPLMTQVNGAAFSTNFTVSIEAAKGVTTGISAADRAKTIQAAINKEAKATDLVQPGHIFPVMAKPGGVLQRGGHTEAGCDLARIAGFNEPASAIIEIMNEDGTMSRRDDLEKFAAKHDLKIGTIADLIHYRLSRESTIIQKSSELINTKYGEFNCVEFFDSVTNSKHLALIKGELQKEQACFVRVHQVETMKDLLGIKSKSWSFSDAMEFISKQESGVLVLLSSENIIASQNSTKSEKNKGGNYLTIGTGAQILRALNVGKMKLLSSPLNFVGLSGFDLEVLEIIDFKD